MPFVRFRSLGTSSSSVRYSPWSTGLAPVGTDDAKTWVPSATTVSEGTLRCTTALTGVQRYDVNFQVALVGNGSTMQLTSATGSGVSVRTTMGATLPTFSDPADTSATRHIISALKQNTPPNQNTRMCFAYNVTNEDDISWYGTGQAENAVTLSGTERFMALDWSGEASASTLTESVTQMSWPATGVFKRLIVRYTVSDPVTLNLRVNGVSMLTLALPAGTDVFASDLTSQVSVIRGDLVNWRYIRNSGADADIQWTYVIGFAGSAV